MADMILGSAQGAVDSLLGRLTSALLEEAQLLGGVRGDVEFIKDEMESMNGFLMHVAEATGENGEDHQVRAWMKQVAEVAYASQNCVDLYVQSLGPGDVAREQGIRGYVCRLARLAWTVRTRHRIATRIRELKIRAREVGERRQRYGVEAPTNRSRDGAKVNKVPLQGGGDDGAIEEEAARRRALAEAEPPPFDHKGSVIKLLMDAGGDHADRLQDVKVIVIVGPGGIGKTTTAQMVWKDPVVVSFFEFKAWICVSLEASATLLLREVLQRLAVPADQSEGKEEDELVEMIQIRLQGNRSLLVLDDVWNFSVSSFNKIRSAFSSGNCSPDSVILITTRFPKIANSFSPCESFNMDSYDLDYYATFFSDKAIALLNSNHQTTNLQPVLKAICGKLVYGECNRLFLHALYVNPDRTLDDFQILRDNLNDSPSNNENQVQKLLYTGLSSNCKNCLLYLTIFPKGATFRRTRFIRRWVVEGMITKRGRLSALDEADCCLDTLVAHGFIEPKDTDVTGKVKSCAIPDLIHNFATEIARDEEFIKTNIPLDLAHRLSVHHKVQLRQAVQQHVTHSKACRDIGSCFNRSHLTEIDESNATEMFLESIPSAKQLGLLEVLDLENCKELKEHHLKNICKNVFQLKYLSIRNTNIAELPKQLDKLQYLKTLDILETKVRALAKNSIVLPKLKYLLAGHKIDSQDGIQLEPFFTVHMPKHVGAMTELQVLSHVKVLSWGDELLEAGNLVRLRKLGVVLQGPQQRDFRHLYHAIGKLSRSLRTLSIQAIADRTSSSSEGQERTETLLIPPLYLQTLEISGLVSGFPAWVEKLSDLTKLTLHKTLLTADDIKILGRLTSLCYLRLWKESCSERTLTFSQDEFQSLKFLVIEFSDVTIINFGDKAAPKLKKIVWSSNVLQSLTGIEKLLSLKVLKLTGNFDLERVKRAIAANTNGPILETNSNDT